MVTLGSFLGLPLGFLGVVTFLLTGVFFLACFLGLVGSFGISISKLFFADETIPMKAYLSTMALILGDFLTGVAALSLFLFSAFISLFLALRVFRSSFNYLRGLKDLFCALDLVLMGLGSKLRWLTC